MIKIIGKISLPPVPLTPDFGSIWKVPNKIWGSFAREKDPEGLHPGVISSKDRNRYTYQLTPGTSSKSGGRCVYKTIFTSQEKKSYFILKLSIPITKTRLLELGRGWCGVDDLSSDDIERLKDQIFKCNNRRKR